MAEEKAVSESKKSNPVIIVIALLAFGFVFGGFGFYKYNIGKKSASWPVVQGKMTYARAVPTKVNNSQEYRLSVKYTYSVDGKSYSGDRITASDGYQKTRRKANDVLKKYPVGKEVSVYYSPSDPSLAVLKTGANKNAFMLMSGGVICFLLAAVIIVSELKKRLK
jgi:hypothetical protein